MQFYKRTLLSVLVTLYPFGIANAADENKLDEINVVAKAPAVKTFMLGQKLKGSDQVIEGKSLKDRATTIGEALSNQIGIHANQFGGGASSPVIRGQEGHRIKVLNNSAEMGDMSSMSPDHAMMVDSLLAKRIEIVRGTPTLLYSSGNVAGIVNVVDEKIPTEIPKKGYSGSVNVRYGSNNHEKLISSGVTLGMEHNLALRLEGLSRRSNDYAVPRTFGHTRIADTWANSSVGNIGLSWIKDKTFIGVSFSERNDKYGLPAHNHEYENCHADIIRQSTLISKSYLKIYPHLLEEADVDYDNPGLSCGHFHSHSHNHDADEQHGSPFIKLRSKRYDLKANIDQPFAGFDALRIELSKVDYKHNEKEGNIVSGFFKNKGENVRIELAHKPIHNISGVWGVQYLTQKNSATGAKPESIRQELLINNKTKQISLFAIEQLNVDRWSFELGSRLERQVAKVDYDMDLLQRNNFYGAKIPSLAPHKETAFSYSGVVSWDFVDDYRVSLIASHQERLPTTQELYAHGKHIATNSFEVGNKNLTKEKSNNIELALAYNGDALDYRVSVYYNQFKNYIYAKTLNSGRGPKSIESYKDLRLNRYTQSGAKFYGIEGELNYHISPRYKVGLFGDYVRGKLVHIPDIPGGKDPYGKREMLPQQDRNAPRVPPARLGLRLNTQINSDYSAQLEYYRVFTQHKVSDFEYPTKGHHMLNIGLNYEKSISDMDWKAYVKVDNVLNQRVYSHASFLSDLPQMGRNILVGLNVDF